MPRLQPDPQTHRHRAPRRPQSRRIRLRHRPLQLRRQVLAGWADAQLRTLDAAPLNQIGELAAQALGLPTFTRHGARFRLRSTIERRRFPDRPNTVHAAHRCAQHWPEQLLLPMARHDKPNTQTPN